jgi:hypothetical protein
MPVAPVKGTLDQFLGRHLKHLAQTEKSLKGMGPSRLELLVMSDGKIVFQNIFLNHSTVGTQLPVAFTQLFEGVVVFHVASPCPD